MVAHYLKLILAEAFRPTVRWTDALQIVAAALIPALHRIVGLPMPDGGQDMTFAYIGYAVVALIVLRLIFYAPYAVWAKTCGDLKALSDQVGSPRKRIADAVEKHMIENRIKAIDLLARMRMPNALAGNPDIVFSNNAEIFHSLNTLLASDRSLKPTLDRMQQAYARRVLTEKLEFSGEHKGDPHLKDALLKARAEYREALESLYDYLMARDGGQ